MALVSRCTKHTEWGSSVCAVIADDYNDRILNQEILNQELNNKIVIVREDVNTMGNVNAIFLLKRMKEFRANVMNSTLNYYDLRGEVERHYQELKSIRKQQWRLEKETTTPWWPLSLRSTGDCQTYQRSHTNIPSCDPPAPYTHAISILSIIQSYELASRR